MEKIQQIKEKLLAIKIRVIDAKIYHCDLDRIEDLANEALSIIKEMEEEEKWKEADRIAEQIMEEDIAIIEGGKP
jgi:lantibiotic modifying enzyme